MRTKYIISILLLVMGLSVMSQTVHTPWGTEVDVYEQDEQSSLFRARSDMKHNSYVINGAIFHETWSDPPTYPFLSSSSTFNCHGYAWHMYWFGDGHDLDDPYNMHSYEAENYFDDPSFVECTESEADILWINDGAHSALTTDDPDELISKWATGPLATHGKGSLQSPWPPIAPNTVIYYKKCYEEYSGIYYTDNTLNECSAQFENSGTSNYVDLEIEYEIAIRFEGIFSTGTGSTLYFHPD